MALSAPDEVALKRPHTGASGCLPGSELGIALGPRVPCHFPKQQPRPGQRGLCPRSQRSPQRPRSSQAPGWGSAWPARGSQESCYQQKQTSGRLFSSSEPGLAGSGRPPGLPGLSVASCQVHKRNHDLHFALDPMLPVRVSTGCAPEFTAGKNEKAGLFGANPF